MIARITSDDPDEVMPPPESKLSVDSDEIETLKQWIDAGANVDSHWSFMPIEKIEVPSDKAHGHPIDAFINKKLKTKDMNLSNSASPQTLIRRVAFDLTGLPPSKDDIQEFTNDDSPKAYEKMVDRFLSKSSYGERMTSHWLDIARYSDSYGYQVDRDRFVWPWRDWVIKAFNDNKPYSEFITEQIAGDMLPNATDDQIQATTFSRLHPQKVEGGSTEEEFRVEYVADRVHTFGTAFLGLTLECARCHDHKYDPLSQEEYYKFFSYFQNISESGLYSYFTPSVPTPTMRIMDEVKKKNYKDLKQTVQDVEKLLIENKEVKTRFDKWIATNPKPEINGQILHLDFEKGHGKIYKKYSGTFLSFADYMKPSIRLAALMKIDPIQVFTHDSIGLGEDGPTHQPIEQINMLRLIPNSYVFRPCDLKETIVCWKEALKIDNAPSFICLSRQNLPQISNKKLVSKNFKGAYVISGPNKNNDITIIATGSEVSLAVNIAEVLKNNGIIAKVISMPSTSIFEKQSRSFKITLLDSKLDETFVIEAGSTMYWNKFTNSENIFGLDIFGASAPGIEVFKKFGLTTKTISTKILRKINTK